MLVTGVSKKGGRAVNEDFYSEARAGGIVCVVVADGLGGHKGGNIASKMAINTIIEVFKSSPEFSEEAISKYINAANNSILNWIKTEPDYVYMATTIAVLLVKGRKAVWANVGDTRIYYFEGKRIEEVTEDHSVAFSEFMNGTIEYDGIRTSENQNKLTNALGVSFKGADVHEMINVTSASSFLICTDGWWEYVKEEQMENSLRVSADTREWLKQMLNLHEMEAPTGCDNYTAAAVMI